MKKVLSIALVLAMLLAMMVPMTLSTSAVEVPKTIADLAFYEEYDATKNQDPAYISNTGWDAYKGTPSIDGKYADGEAWDNALPLIINDSTVSTIANCAWGAGRDAEFYLMWDENYLYFLQVDNKFDWSKVTKTSIGSGNLWTGGYNGTQLGITANKDGVVNGTSYNVYQVNSMPISYEGKNPSTFEIGVQYRGSTNMRVRTMKLAMDGPKVWKSGDVQGYTDESDSIISYFTKTGDKGLVMETKIPWSELGISSVAASATDVFMGVSLYHGASGNFPLTKHGSKNGISLEGDSACNSDPIKLLESKDQAQGGTDRDYVKAVKADVDFFVAEGTGVLRTAGEATIEIDSAEKLLGLSYAMENYSYDTNTKGKTFVITKDINLNPGITDWANFDPDTYHAPEKMFWELSPLQTWLSLDEFYGNIDGQGHTITGFYSPAAAHGTSSATGDWGLFGGRKPEGDVKNVVIGGGYIRDHDAGGFGIVWAVSYHTAAADVNATSTIENVFVSDDFTMVINKNDSGAQAGPLINGPWSNTGGTLHIDIKNVVVNANVIVTDANVATVGNCFGVWRFNNDTSYGGSKFTMTATDIVIQNKVVSNGKVDDTISGKDGVTRAVYAPKGVPAKNADIWTQTTLGVMPNQVADMLAEYAWQSTQAVDGKYNVRIIGEAFDLDFATMGFKVRLIKNGTEYAEFNNADNKTVYMSVMAANETKTAADMNVGLYDDVENGMYVLTLNGLDADATYTVEVVSVWTLEDGTTVESVVAKTATVSAYVPSAS